MLRWQGFENDGVLSYHMYFREGTLTVEGRDYEGDILIMWNGSEVDALSYLYTPVVDTEQVKKDTLYFNTVVVYPFLARCVGLVEQAGVEGKSLSDDFLETLVQFIYALWGTDKIQGPKQCYYELEVWMPAIVRVFSGPLSDTVDVELRVVVEDRICEVPVGKSNLYRVEGESLSEEVLLSYGKLLEIMMKREDGVVRCY